MTATLACPQCEEPKQEADHKFCTKCGLALEQPCPHCSSRLSTPQTPFVTCQTCQQDFWSCQSCGRLYHLDRTSCQNSYCPERGEFWTTRFGTEEFHQHPRHRCLDLKLSEDESPRPAWVGGTTAGNDRRWPNLHTLGLILSVQETGVVELWAERGAPHKTKDTDFGESSVCLTRLDLGQESPSAPFFWNGQFYIPGESSLSVLDMTSSPSLGLRIDLEDIKKPLHFCPLPERVLVWGESGLGEVTPEGSFEQVDSRPASASGCKLISDGRTKALRLWGASAQADLLEEGVGVVSVGDIGLDGPAEYAIYADRFVVISGNKLAYFKRKKFAVVELPASVISQPLYSETDNRLILMLNDGSIRSCSPAGDKFSFVCDLAGTPSTWPLKLGERIFYGTEGRYLCCDKDAIRPRLSSPPSGALSYANGRVFGTLRDGSVFCFEL